MALTMTLFACNSLFLLATFHANIFAAADLLDLNMLEIFGSTVNSTINSDLSDYVDPINSTNLTSAESGAIEERFYGDAKIIDVTNWFLSKLQPGALPDNLLSDSDLKNADRLPEALNRNWKEWMNYELGFVIVATSYLTIGVLFTLCFSIYVCCYRNQKCGRKKEYAYKSSRAHEVSSFKSKSTTFHHAAQIKSFPQIALARFCYNVALFILITLITLLTVCASISNITLHQSMYAFGDFLRNSTKDINGYKTETNQKLYKLLVTDYGRFTNEIDDALNQASDKYVASIFGTNNESVQSQADEAFLELDAFHLFVARTMADIDDASLELQLFNANISELDSWLSREITVCGNESACRELREHLAKYQTTLQRSSLSDSIYMLSRRLQDFSVAVNFSEQKNEFYSRIEKMRTDITDQIAQEKNIVDDKLKDIGNDLEQNQKSVSKHISSMLFDQHDEFADNFIPPLLVLEDYRYIAYFVICGLVGLITLLIFLGFLYSAFGHKPVYGNSSKCCLWSKSDGFFNCASSIACLLLGLLMVVSCLLFVIGGNSRVMFCQHWPHDLKNSGVYKMSKRVWNITRQKTPSTNSDAKDLLGFEIDNLAFSTIVDECSRNATLFSLLISGRHSGLPIYEDLQQKIKDDSAAYIERIENYPSGLFDKSLFLNAINGITSYLRAPEFTAQFVDEILSNVTNLNFTQNLLMLQEAVRKSKDAHLKATLISLYTKLQDLTIGRLPTVKSRIDIVAFDFEVLLSDQIPAALKVLNRLNDLTASAESSTESSQSIAGDLVQNLTNKISNLTFSYQNDVMERLNNNVGNCAPLQKMAYNLVDMACFDVVDHFNAFWTALSFALLLLILTLIFVAKLKSAYSAWQMHVDNISGGSANSRRYMMDVYSTITDDYSCYRRGSGMSYNNSAGHK